AVDLDGPVADTQQTTRHLARVSGDDVLHHFAFSRGEKRQSSPAFVAAFVRDLAAGRVLERALYTRHQEFVVERLLDEIRRARLHRRDGRGDLTRPGEKNDGKAESALRKRRLQLEAGHLR